MTQFVDYITHLHSELTQQKQRGLVRLCGSQAQCYQQLNTLLALSKVNSEKNTPNNFLNKSEHKESLPTIDQLDVVAFIEPGLIKDQSVQRKNEWRLKKFRKYLGQECDILIYDAYQGFNADAFAALSGIVRQGGVLVLITPSDEKWLILDDPEQHRFLAERYQPKDLTNNFVLHLLSVLQKNLNNGVYVYNLTNPSESLAEVSPTKKTSSSILSKAKHSTSPHLEKIDVSTDSKYVTADQRYIAGKIHELLGGLQSRYPVADQPFGQRLLISADRGRGKSSVVGLSTADWVNHNVAANTDFNIVVTSSSKESTSILIEHFESVIANPKHSAVFYSPDHIIERASQQIDDIDLLIIDEAASIPVSVVQQLVNKVPKVILATTIHGYEGTGRGLEYKLKPWLVKHSCSFQHLTMKQPIRWTESDNLERIINTSLCFCVDIDATNKRIQEIPLLDIVLDTLTLKREVPLDLVKSGQVAKLFGLLTEAHYQTTPNDLRSMLDNPSMQIFSLYQGDQLAATALISLEGGFDADNNKELMGAIWQGVRRPRGHLAPQSLIAHCGFKNAGYFNYARIVRIAVSPHWQSKGVGTVFLNKLECHFKQHGNIDFLSTSFGYDAKVISFWQKSKFMTVRLGLKPDASTGLVSVLMLKALQKSTSCWAKRWSARFDETLKMEVDVGWRELSYRQKLSPQGEHRQSDSDYLTWSTQQNHADLQCLSQFYRSPDSCLLAIRKITESSDAEIPALIEDKFITGVSNKVLIKSYNFSGEKELVSAIRAQSSILLNRINE